MSSEPDSDPFDQFVEDPIAQFQLWFNAALAAGVVQPEAVALATATPEGHPSVRMVLHKGVSGGGLVFFSNYESRKGQELKANPRAAMAFYWQEQERQIRVEGRVERLSREDSESYFHSRSRGSQIGAWTSRQSHVIPDREYLKSRFAQFSEEYKDNRVPCPPYWGGYRLVPELIEFWFGRTSRLHDRLRYRRGAPPLPGTKGEWIQERLSP